MSSRSTKNRLNAVKFEFRTPSAVTARLLEICCSSICVVRQGGNTPTQQKLEKENENRERTYILIELTSDSLQLFIDIFGRATKGWKKNCIETLEGEKKQIVPCTYLSPTQRWNPHVLRESFGCGAASGLIIIIQIPNDRTRLVESTS